MISIEIAGATVSSVLQSEKSLATYKVIFKTTGLQYISASYILK